jgi:peptidoglycan-associated lipoprotein
MKHSRILHYTIILLASSFTLWGCPKNAQVTAAPEASTSETPVAAAPYAGEQREAGMRTGGEPSERSALSSSGLKPIFFDFDKSFVRDDARRTMKANAEWLKAHPKATVRIEGNCDERGTREYNQALGQRRATSAKKFLMDLGIPAKRITLLSYGKEKQVCTEGSEECWQKNRRGDFVGASE